MQSYLNIYHNSRSSPPLSKALNRFVANRAWATGAIGVGTIAVECVVIPATLFMPPAWRGVGSAIMISLHVGIALVMSGQVGLLFLTALPSYLAGFGCDALVGSRPWWVAAAVGLLPSLASIIGFPPGESWPLSPVSLFMWSGETANILARALMVGDTRVAMSSTAGGSLNGLQVVPPGVTCGGGVDVLHDVLTRAIGFTLCQGELVDAAMAIRESSPGGGWDISLFLKRLQDWLGRDQRLLEIHTGKALQEACFVRIGPRATVASVLQRARLTR